MDFNDDTVLVNEERGLVDMVHTALHTPLQCGGGGYNLSECAANTEKDVSGVKTHDSSFYACQP